MIFPLPVTDTPEIVTPTLLGKITISPSLAYFASGPAKITFPFRQALVKALVGTIIPLRSTSPSVVSSI